MRPTLIGTTVGIVSGTDPRIVTLYDIDNPGGQDHDFYRSVADRIGAERIVDLGCGTGLLTVSMAETGRTVIGIDPDPGMLDRARSRPGADSVQWILGDSGQIGHVSADLVVMTGNVAQHIPDETWKPTLNDIRAGLRVGGTVAFESRNPAVRAWLQWDREHTYGTRDTADGRLTEWMEITQVDLDRTGTVTFEAHNVFEATGERLVITETLTFRDRDTLAADLAAAGLEVRNVWGGWRRDPFTDDSPIMIFEAVRPG